MPQLTSQEISASPPFRVNGLIAALLACGLVALALVPDEAVLRQKVTWTEGLLAAAACLVFLDGSLRGRWACPGRPVLFAAGALAAIALAHGILGAARGTLISRSLAHDEIERLVLLPLMAWACACVARSPTARATLVGTLVLASLPVCAYALAQNLAGVLPLPVNHMPRSASTFGNPVFLGAYLVLVIPLGATAALYGRGLMRWAGALATGLGLPALLATQSRAAWLGAGIGFALGLALLAPTRLWRRRLLAGLALLAVALAALSFPVLLRPQHHALIWRDTLDLVAAHPWGVGPGQFQVAFLPFASPELLAEYPRNQVIINDAHCEPLQLLAELGPAGLLAALVFVLLLARLAVDRLRGAEGGERPLVVALVAGLAGAATQSLLSPDLRFTISTLLFAVLVGLLASLGPEPPVAFVPGGRIGRALGVLLALAGLAAVGNAAWERLSISRLLTPDAAWSPDPQRTADAGLPARIAQCEALARAAPDDPARQYELGLACAQAGQYERAIASFREAVRLNPGAPGLHRSLGVAEALAGQTEAALADLAISLRDRPDDPDLQYLVAFLNWGRGDIASALRELEELLAVHPDHRNARLLLEKLRE